MLKATGTYKVNSMLNYMNVNAKNQQLTPFKQTDSTVKIDHDAIAYWSHILKDFAIKIRRR